MTRTRTLALGAAAAALVLVATLCAVVFWPEEDDGAESVADAYARHAQREDRPERRVNSAATGAESVMECLYLWTPPAQASPWDEGHGCAGMLTGRAAAWAARRPDPDPSPADWPTWAAEGTRLIGYAERDPGGGDGPGASAEGSVGVTVHQFVLAPDGSATARRDLHHLVHVVREGEIWKGECWTPEIGQ